MSKLLWDQIGEKTYETGVKNGVLYVMGDNAKYGKGVAWNGLTGVTESPSGAEETALYADDIKYLSLRSAEELGATIEAYTYPDEFMACDGSEELATGVVIGQQTRKMFGVAYVTTYGNDTQLNDYGYKLHILYGATASPSERAYATINESPEAITFSWEITTTKIAVKGHKPTSIITIDSTKAGDKMAAIEAVLFGADDFDDTVDYVKGDTVTEAGKTYIAPGAVAAGTFDADQWTLIGEAGPRLPLPDEVATIMANA